MPNKPPAHPLLATVAEAPTGPGCYFFRDVNGKAVYVGKAVQLRRRLRSYFNRPEGHSRMTAGLLADAASVDWLETGSEVEALLLENQLIKELQPRLNSRLRDQKDYPLLAITREEFPQVFITRDRELSGVDFIGPFTNPTDLRQAYNFLMRVFQFRSCDLRIRSDDKRRKTFTPCLNYHIKRCSAPCTTKIDAKTYQDDIRALRSFISGRGTAPVRKALKARMYTASEKMQYEEAARLRDQLQALERLSERGRLKDYAVDMPAPVPKPGEAAERLAMALSLSSPPRLIEGFDIAHYMGEHVVASMVHFADGMPVKELYRQYKIRGPEGDGNPGNNDFLAMREVIARRYQRLRDEGQTFPDIVLIDGGLGQVRMAESALREVGVIVPCLIGLAKAEEILVRSDGAEIALGKRHPGLKLLMSVRDEAHRFCRRYLHQLQRKKVEPRKKKPS